MSRLYFIRHAKAVEEGKDGPKDFSRELSGKGKEDARALVEQLKSRKVRADAIFSSSAKRCEQTAKILTQGLKFEGKIGLFAELYDASLTQILEFARSLDDRLDEVFIIAHNPGITEICEYLSSVSIGFVPTSGTFCVEIDCEFSQISQNCAKAIFFEYPKKSIK